MSHRLATTGSSLLVTTVLVTTVLWGCSGQRPDPGAGESMDHEPTSCVGASCPCSSSTECESGKTCVGGICRPEDTCEPSACGGCEPLEHAPGDPCGECGTYACSGPDELACEEAGANACGGCQPLALAAGAACGTCGIWVCAGANNLECENQENECGGCGVLAATPGESCGVCGEWVCGEAGAVACDDPGPNACGGCGAVPQNLGGSCGDCGTLVCDGDGGVTCDDPGTNACSGCDALAATPGESCGSCGEYVCDGPEAVRCEAPSYTTVIPPASADGCSTAEEHFNFGACGGWKIYDVTPGAWLGLAARGDGCSGCVLYHIAFAIQEDTGGGWATVETHDPEPDAKGMRYETSYRPTTDRVRVVATSSPGFYLKLYDRGIENGGFESQSGQPFTVLDGQQGATLTSDSTYVAARGASSLGASYTGATYGSSDAHLWSVSTPVCSFTVGPASTLSFDTYGANHSCYAHYHVTLGLDDGSSVTHDSYADYCAGIAGGWSLQRVELAGDQGKTITDVEISFHKDHSGFARYAPTIYIDNISLR